MSKPTEQELLDIEQKLRRLEKQNNHLKVKYQNQKRK